MLNISLYILVGVIAGVLSGLVGIGGGIIIVPTLVFLFGLSQHQAQGTTLALLLPPIGLLAVLTYYKQGYIVPKIAFFMCIGFIIGGLLGAKIAVSLPTEILRKVFGIALLLIALRMILFK